MWPDALEYLSAQRGWRKISEMYIFLVLLLRAVSLVLIWMASLETCLLSWSITLK